MPREIAVTRHREAIYRKKAFGTVVQYYLFDEYEVHVNIIDPNTVQDWHHHVNLIEAILVTNGLVAVRYRRGSAEELISLSQGDLVDVGTVAHRLENLTSEPATFIVFRCMRTGQDARDAFTSDKISDEE